MNIQYKTPQVCVFESALFRTTSTVFTSDDLILVVDPTWLPHEIEAIRNHVYKIKKDQPVYLLFTHSDYDHIIGYQAFPGATVIASAAFVTNTEIEAILRQIRHFDDEYYITRAYPIVYPRVDIVVDKDEFELQIGNTRLIFWQSPGHNPDGLFTLIEPYGIWIAGDYLSNIEFPFIYHSSVEYETTLKKAEKILTTFRPQLLIPGHGDITTEMGEMHLRLTDSLVYIQKLRASIQGLKAFNTASLWKRYQFPGVMGRYHEDNIKLIAKELGL